MAKNLPVAIRQLFRTLGAPAEEDRPSDRRLLDQFARRHDDGAFTELIRRHGAMVFGVCRGILRDAYAAEDAFQATWLVLARKAGAVAWREDVGGWLYAVAYRVAHKARSQARRLRSREVPLSTLDLAAAADEDRRELVAQLWSELERLPERYRAPLVLCYLEGKTHAEAARALGWPVGSMSRRLARAAGVLQRRLLGAGAAALSVPEVLAGTARAVPAEPLREAALRAGTSVRGGPAGSVPASVRGLAAGAVADMRRKLLKAVGILLLSGAALIVSAAVGIRRPPSAAPPPARPADPQPAVRRPDPTPAQEFSSPLPMYVYQIVEGQAAPRWLGLTGPWQRRPVAIPPGARWYVQPLPPGSAFGGGGGIIGNGAGALGLRGSDGLGISGRTPGANRPAATPGASSPEPALRLTGKDLRTWLREMKRRDVPGLCLIGKEFTGADLAELKALPGLRILLLQGARVGNDDLKHLAALPELRTVGLEGTAATDAGLKWLRDVKKLSELRLGGSRITNIGMSDVAAVGRLRALRLSWTGVDGDGLAALREGLDRLETLELSGDFGNSDLASLKGWGSLKTLRLHRTRVTDAGLKYLRELPNLRVLSLDSLLGWSRLDELPRGRQGLPRRVVVDERREIDLAGRQRITDRGMKTLASLQDLTSLTVVSEDVGDEGAAALKDLKRLRKLSLLFTVVTNDGLKPLAGLKHLEILDLRATLTTPEAAETLKTLPRLKVLYPNEDVTDERLRKIWQRELPHAVLKEYEADETVSPP